MRRIRLPLLVGLFLALFWSGYPAGAVVTVKCWQVIRSRPCVDYVIADTEAELLLLTNAPDGVHAVAVDTQTLYCPVGGTWSACGSAGGGAPTTVEYIVAASSAGLSAERVCTDTATVDCNMGTAGQAKFDVIPGGVDHGALGGLSDDDHAQYAMLAGRSGGQTLSGSSLTAEGFELFANAVDTYPRLTLGWLGGVNAYFELDAVSGAGERISCDADFGCSWHVAAGNVWQFTEAPLSPIAQLDSTGHMAFENYLGLGSSALSTATQSCAWVDSDRWFGDLDCDGTKDGGEEYFDEPSGSGGLSDGDYGDVIVGGSGTTMDIDQADVETELEGVLDLPDLQGQVSAANIASDAVTEQKLKAVDSATDEECLTYESTTGDFEWQICETDTSHELDYNPDRKPSSGLDANGSDEFTGSINTSIRTWGNQGTATEAAEFDAFRLNAAASTGNDRKVVWYALPASGDWVFSTAITAGILEDVADNQIYGLITLVTGSIATPTLLEFGIIDRFPTGLFVGMFNATSYTGTNNNGIGTSTFDDQLMEAGEKVYMRMQFVDSSNALQFYVSKRGMGWNDTSTRTLGNNPTYVGFFQDQNTANNASEAYFHFVRLCTSGPCVSTPWPIGE